MRCRFAVRVLVRSAACAWAGLMGWKFYHLYQVWLDYEMGTGGHIWPKGGPRFLVSIPFILIRYGPILVLLLVSERWLVRWLIPVPFQGCVRCGYSRDGDPAPACPECGLVERGEVAEREA